MSKKGEEAIRTRLRECARARALEGRQLEYRVERILRELVAERGFDAYTRHKPFSRADLQGKDFTVWRGRKHWSFGVTVSARSACRSYTNHPRWPTFWCWPGIADEVIKGWILSIPADPRFPPEED
jgi:hypothetical protein